MFSKIFSAFFFFCLSFLLLTFVLVKKNSPEIYNNPVTINSMDSVTNSVSKYRKVVDLDRLEGYWRNTDFLYGIYRVDNEIIVKENTLVIMKQIHLFNSLIFDTYSAYYIKSANGKVINLEYAKGLGKGLVNKSQELLIEKITDEELVISTPMRVLHVEGIPLTYTKRY